MKKLLSIIIAVMFSIGLNAQTSVTEAPDFTTTDYFGNEINLYEILEGGQHVLLHFNTRTNEATPEVTPPLVEAYKKLGCNQHDVFFIGIVPNGTSNITKKYVEAMKGTISFESVYGAGTTFHVDIPQKIVGTRLIKEDKEEDVSNETIEFIDCSQYKVLIVDDDVLDIKVTKRLIEKYKFQITTLTSSSECIDRIKAEEEYDILFLDHKMPEIDGMQTMKILKGLEGYKIPKIIALTANAVTGDREYYLKEGFDDYISKTIDTHELDRIIKKSINKKA